MLIFLLDIYIFGLDQQGPEGLAALLVETVEEFQALEPQVMNVAAQQIQREVEHIADEGDDHEADHPAC